MMSWRCELIRSSVHLLGLHNILILQILIKNKDLQQYVVLKTESGRVMVFLSSGYLRSVTCCQNSTVEWHLLKSFKARSSCNSISSISAADTSVTKG